MRKIYTIRVTKKDIREGIPHSFKGCPIALAAKRVFKGKLVWAASDLEVGTKWCSEKNRFYKLPNPATNFMNRFDDGRSVRPFTFRAVEFGHDN